MKFKVADSIYAISDKNIIGLVIDKWNDWYTYCTMYTVIYFDRNDSYRRIGSIKIGEAGLPNGRPSIPMQFEQLEESFFSLGQSDEYYMQLNDLGGDIREEILKALNDVAYNNKLYYRFKDQSVMGSSLMRDVAQTTVLGQYHRVAHGMARLSEYNFNYELRSEFEGDDNITLHFEVYPQSTPPTNVHVVIGRNGVGKTFLLTNMVRSFLSNDGMFYEKEEDGEVKDATKIFAGLVFVSFSAFDYDVPIKTRNQDIRYNYVGLKMPDEDCENLLNKKVEDLTNEFVETLKNCFVNSKVHLWKNIISILNSDPIFKENSISKLLGDNEYNEEKNRIDSIIEGAGKVFSTLSSGHKIVLLTLSSLIARVEERTLVLIDEPEVHLHPPLLAAFTRAISELLINRNGVAILATHSPVVLQEVPSTCVWKLRRYGMDVKVERPNIECFGENLGVLTSEVFRHEVSESGVHKILQDIVNDDERTFDEIIQKFKGQLGFEAQAILRILIAEKERMDANE